MAAEGSIKQDLTAFAAPAFAALHAWPVVANSFGHGYLSSAVKGRNPSRTPKPSKYTHQHPKPAPLQKAP